MALWGITSGTEDKPKYLKQEDKNNTVAKAEGWVLKKAVGSRNLEEILEKIFMNTEVINYSIQKAMVVNIVIT